MRLLQRAVLLEVGEDGADGDGFLDAGDDPHRAAMLELRADTLLSRGGGCAEALPAYVALTAEARGTALARAWTRTGQCAAQLGRTEQAAEAFDAARSVAP